MAIRIRGRFMATPLGGHRVDHHRPLTELGASGKCRLPCLAWRLGGWIVLGGGEGGPAPEGWGLGSCVHVGLGDWRHSCLGFCPGTAAAWTVTGIASPFWASFSLCVQCSDCRMVRLPSGKPPVSWVPGTGQAWAPASGDLARPQAHPSSPDASVFSSELGIISPP